jgi:hypothetical protein
MTAIRQRLPNRRGSISFNFVHNGFTYSASASRHADGLAEVFLTCSKAGSAAQQHAETAAILTSLLLQHGVPAEAIAHAVRGSAIATAIEMAVTP